MEQHWVGKCTNSRCSAPDTFKVSVKSNSVNYVTCEGCRNEYRIVVVAGQSVQMSDTSVLLKAVTDADGPDAT